MKSIFDEIGDLTFKVIHFKVVHRMRIAMGYDFASMTFDLKTQLKGQICHFVMKLMI